MKELRAVGINQRVAHLPAAGQPGLELEGSREGCLTSVFTVHPQRCWCLELTVQNRH